MPVAIFIGAEPKMIDVADQRGAPAPEIIGSTVAIDAGAGHQFPT